MILNVLLRLTTMESLGKRKRGAEPTETQVQIQIHHNRIVCNDAGLASTHQALTEALFFLNEKGLDLADSLNIRPYPVYLLIDNPGDMPIVSELVRNLGLQVPVEIIATPSKAKRAPSQHADFQ